jgi:sigma-54 specific flagellar transcriptional regulator A
MTDRDSNLSIEEKATAAAEVLSTPRTLRPTSRGKIVGYDILIRDAIATLERVAPANCTVLITGESGTGKELAVAALHDASPRASAKLVSVNCGAIPENLIESELFGHAKGAFTGAATARDGLIAAAEGGTLFLDEVGELPLAVQVKLLRVLQQKEYTPLGTNKAIKCNVRIVAATNRDLEQEVASKRFREDLYFRLNVIHVTLPSLRQRRMDIPVLAKYFLEQCPERTGRSGVVDISPEAMEVLKGYDWPGNIRELENTIDRAVLLAPGSVIQVSDLPTKVLARSQPAAPPVALPEGGIDLRAAVEEFETKLIVDALTRTGGNKNRAAQLLRLNRTTLVEMVKRKQIA